jgi:isoaspartyl peptidase/L-asparaginase-like protein (Ntn-hydrolase superfamily)
MFTRRKFLKYAGMATGSLGLPGYTAGSKIIQSPSGRHPDQSSGYFPIIISTWSLGIPANKVGWEILAKNGRALDAVEAAVRVVESDPEVQSVGYGGLPDRKGAVSLDAAIMKGNGDCGSVAFLQDIENPISVARKVMEATDHVMLVGEGALEFALEQGFQRKLLLTEKSREAWQLWLSREKNRPNYGRGNHDTIGTLALDSEGRIAGACSTSGVAYKLHGRVGDSPLIGAGLFVDEEVGAATGTGLGESIIKVAGSHTIVEMMRHGASPQEACEEAIRRVVRKNKNTKDLMAGFIAINTKGEYGACSINPGFDYAVYNQEINGLYPSATLKD